MRKVNLAVVVHRQRSCLRSTGFPGIPALLERMPLGWVHFSAVFSAEGASLARADYHLILNHNS